MIIRVAGFNVDLDGIHKKMGSEMTPESIAASYARISRDPRPILEIRKDAREDIRNARELNRRVVFDMGHSSIAEHCIFNIDIMGISRLAAEYVERFRLASYTERSQRYIKINEDFYLPDEFDPETREASVCFVKDSFSLYEKIYHTILPYVENEKRYRDEQLKRRDIEGLAMEDARYLLPLCVTTQLGLTANARNIEYIVKILASSPLKEAREIGRRISEETVKFAPSLIRYTEPEEYFSRHWFGSYKYTPSEMSIKEDYMPENDGVTLLSVNGDILRLISLMIFQNTQKGIKEIEEKVRGMTESERRATLYEIFESLDKHNQLPRLFESIYLEYELIMSASCYAQFKRHRMMTQIPQRYDISLGFEIPPLIKKMGLQPEVLKHYKRGLDLIKKIVDRYPESAEYLILNGQRRRIYVKLNARELYHISRLRMDHHAQWEILRLSNRMVLDAQKRIPYVFDLCSGKDEFEDTKRRVLQ